MKTTLLHSLHEKAMKTIESIIIVESRKKSHVESVYHFKKELYIQSAIDWHEKRAEINEALAARLRVSYNRIIQKILLHKP